jgi:hypothetical protein
LFVTLAAVLLAVAMSATTATAASSPPPASQQALAEMRAQAPLDAAVSRLDAVISRDGRKGFAGISVSTQSNGLTAYWHGTVPQSVAAAFDQERARGINVTVVPAQYTAAQLRRATNMLATGAMGRSAVRGAGVRVDLIAPREDGAGLDVGIDGPAAGDRSAALRALPLLGHLSVPVNLFQSAPPVAALREADTTPYWGGGEMTDTPFPCPSNPSLSCANLCTTGFGVQNSQGQTFILSAAHCSFTTPNRGTSDSWTTGDGGQTTGGLPIGGVSFWSTTHDVMTIGPVSSANHIYACAGISDPANECSLTVTAAGGTNVGDAVCDSGAFSGELCGMHATATGVTIQIVDEQGNTICTCQNMVQADQPTSINAGGNGDSGGPVFAVNSDGSVSARGTLSAEDLSREVPCSGVPTGNSRKCSSRVFFPDITFELADAGVGVLIA